MNNIIIEEISNNLKIRKEQIESTLKLLDSGNTIPFIARYRKEMTGNLNEEMIREINNVYEYQVNLLKRKEDVIKLINEKDLLTPELEEKIMNCSKLVEVEDLYRPYKEKKKTKASDAIAAGLEPLAKIMLSFPTEGDENLITKDFINDKIKTKEEAITGAKYIIAESISDNADYRKWIRFNTFKTGILLTKLKKEAIDLNKTYEMYYEYNEAIEKIKPHRILAVNRAEKEGVISVNINIDKDVVLDYLKNKIIINKNSWIVDYIIEAIEDAYKRLIKPSIEREIRSELTAESETVAIDVFSQNVEKLLLQPPMKDKIILGLDPAFRTGCKLAVIDSSGKILNISVIYPHEPQKEVEASAKHVLSLIEKHEIDIIAIGNGTASRESESFVADLLKNSKQKVSYIIVNEAGASVYSASKLAIKEFPDLNVEQRSAISIAKRLQDPLSELIKIDTKSIGVGEYQHDVSEKKLDESLAFVVTKVVNQVGVNVNTASPSLLTYVSGLNKKSIDKIIAFREEKGRVKTRIDIKRIKGISEKIYEQSIGFIRIPDSSNPLDQTSIHPESYDSTLKLLEKLELSINDLGTEKLKEKLENININQISSEINVDKYTLEDIVKSLKQPSRDFRDDFVKPLLKSDILKIENLTIGMKLQGTVRNVVDFGVFIDIGLKSDGMAHISKLANRYISHPLEIVSVGDIVDCYVDDILQDKGRVSLSLIMPD